MNHLVKAAAGFGMAALASSASAHAFLDHAVPGVGATVQASPGALDLSFTQDIEAPLSSIRLAAAGGGAIPTSKPTKDGANPSTLHVTLSRPLAPGLYVVTWRVVSVDTHATSGSYKFTVAP